MTSEPSLEERRSRIADRGGAQAEKSGGDLPQDEVVYPNQSSVDGPPVAPISRGPGEDRPIPEHAKSIIEQLKSCLDVQSAEYIGKGGQGTTFLITMGDGTQKCAKVLDIVRAHGKAQTNHQGDFREEVAFSRLNDPRVPKFHSTEFLGQGDQVALIRDYVSGQSLRDQLDEKGAIHEKDAIRILTELLELLRDLHNPHAHPELDAEVYHRDVKPGNIILRSSDGKAILVDYGSAHFRGDGFHSRTNEVPGTDGYMPCEQLAGRADARVDIYALGVTVVECLLHGHPELIERLKDNWYEGMLPTGGFQIPENVVPSSGLRLVLQKMIEANFERRYQSAQHVLDALRQVEEGADGGLTSYASKLIPGNEVRVGGREERRQERIPGLLGNESLIAATLGMLSAKPDFPNGAVKERIDELLKCASNDALSAKDIHSLLFPFPPQLGSRWAEIWTYGKAVSFEQVIERCKAEGGYEDVLAAVEQEEAMGRDLRDHLAEVASDGCMNEYERISSQISELIELQQLVKSRSEKQRADTSGGQATMPSTFFSDAYSDQERTVASLIIGCVIKEGYLRRLEMERQVIEHNSSSDLERIDQRRALLGSLSDAVFKFGSAERVQIKGHHAMKYTIGVVDRDGSAHYLQVVKPLGGNSVTTTSGQVFYPTFEGFQERVKQIHREGHGLLFDEQWTAVDETVVPAGYRNLLELQNRESSGAWLTGLKQEQAGAKAASAQVERHLKEWSCTSFAFTDPFDNQTHDISVSDLSEMISLPKPCRKIIDRPGSVTVSGAGRITIDLDAVSDGALFSRENAHQVPDVKYLQVAQLAYRNGRARMVPHKRADANEEPKKEDATKATGGSYFQKFFAKVNEMLTDKFGTSLAVRSLKTKALCVFEATWMNTNSTTERNGRVYLSPGGHLKVVEDDDTVWNLAQGPTIVKDASGVRVVWNALNAGGS